MASLFYYVALPVQHCFYSIFAVLSLTAMSSLKERNEKVCLNCGTGLYGRYCHNCGQENVQPRRPIWEIPWQFVNNVVNVDGKFFSSLRVLLLKPGFLAREFVSGKRTTYYDPVRAYLFSSFLFFIIAAMVFGDMREAIDSGRERMEAMAADSAGRTTLNRLADSLKLDKQQLATQLASRADSVKTGRGDGKGNVVFETTSQVKDFLNRYEKDLQYMLWFSLPGFALILKLLYIRRRIYYWDHLIFALYLYSFNFLVICGGFLLLEAAGRTTLSMLEDIVFFVLFLASMAYAYLSLRNFYGQGYAKTALKFILLSGMTLFLFFLAMILVFVYEYRQQLFS